MSLACSLTPLGNRFGGHFSGKVLADLSAGAGQNMRLASGLYYMRGQAAGGWGGNNFMANGGGGGSGAGFEGYVHINRDLENVAVLSGAVPDNQGDGGQTSAGFLFSAAAASAVITTVSAVWAVFIPTRRMNAGASLPAGWPGTAKTGAALLPTETTVRGQTPF